MATRPTRVTRSRQPSAQPAELPKPRAKLARSASNAEVPMKPPSTTRRANATETRTVSQSSTSTIHEEQPNPPAKAVGSSKTLDSDGEREPIKAYLRIRPNLGDAEAAAPTPYLDRLSDTTVRMSDPGIEDASRTRMRQSMGVADANYTFTHVFVPETSQPTFFASTTLPLVRDLLLNGQNGLLFAYGVTNSGKTYTIQGGSDTGSAGILPRTFDVLFNSIGDLQGSGQFRPIRLQGVAPNDGSVEPDLSLDDLRAAEPALANVLEEFGDDGSGDIDPTVFKLDRNREYTVWISYAEIYNDKVYDLLVPTTPSKMPARGVAHSTAEVVRKALTLKNSPPGDAWDSDFSSGKYADGLQHIRVRSAAEARSVLKLGQLHRRVVGTFANKESSRSHAVVSIKLLRVHRGERTNLSAVQTSRLTLVDLAGSERTKYTQTTGDRLKEAGYINRSLMVLGQCLETLRANQRKIGSTLSGGGRSDTRDTKKGLQVVPFRHNKMTELLMDYFVGDGRVIMIVNVNPFDTGFDENAHVMRFASLAREVSTTVARPPSPTKLPIWQGSQTKAPAKPPPKRPSGSRRSVTVSLGGNAPMTLDILEEDEETTEVEEDDSDYHGPQDAFIRELFDENDGLRAQLYEAHMRAAAVEAETREEVMNAMQDRMRQLEEMWQNRCRDQELAFEQKLARKMELFGGASLGQAGPSRYAEDVDMDGYDTEEAEEFDIEKSLTQDALHSYSPEPPTPLLSGNVLPPITPEPEPEQDDRPMTPIASSSTTRLPSQPEDDNPIPTHLPDLDLDLDSAAQPDGDDDEEMAAAKSNSSDEEAEYKPPPSKKPRHSKPVTPVLPTPPVPILKGSAKAPIVIDLDDDDDEPVVHTKPHVKGKGISLADMDDLDDVPDADPDRSGIAVIPNRKARAAATVNGGPGVTYIPLKGEVDTVKKKKRVLAKKPVVTEDQIDRLVYRQEQEQGGRPVRRITRRS